MSCSCITKGWIIKACKLTFYYLLDKSLWKCGGSGLFAILVEAIAFGNVNNDKLWFRDCLLRLLI